MPIKDSYGFKAKELARENLKNFIAEHYSERERKNLKVLTLLGHENYELEQIWDVLGVPRENITVVEENSKIYKVLEDKLEDPDFNVDLLPKQSIDDFIQETDEKFDIINLDYQGYFNEEKKQTLDLIAYRGILEKRGVLATWYSGKRENPATTNMRETQDQTLMREIATGVLNAVKANPNSVNKKAINDAMGYALKRLNDYRNGNTRSDFISDQVFSSFGFPVLNFEKHPLIEYFGLEEKFKEHIKDGEKFKERNKDFLKAVLGNKIPEGVYNKEAFEAFKKIRKKIKANQKITAEDEDPLFNEFIAESHRFVKETLSRKLKRSFVDKRYIPGEGFFNACSDIISFSYLNPYFNKDLQRFFYVSNKGTPMYLDINLFEKPKFHEFLKWKLKDKRISVRNCFMKNDRNRNKLNQFMEDLYNNLMWNKDERKTIVVPEISTPLTNTEIYSLINKGQTDAEILERDPSLNPRCIPRYRAHVTMDKNGTKKGRPRKNQLEQEVLIEQDTPKLKIEDETPIENSKYLSKEEAIEFLKAGFTPEDICFEYPGSFTKKQLGAFKAWYVTMGKKVA